MAEVTAHHYNADERFVFTSKLKLIFAAVTILGLALIAAGWFLSPGETAYMPTPLTPHEAQQFQSANPDHVQMPGGEIPHTDAHVITGIGPRLWANFLISNVYWLLLSLAGPVFIAINYLSNAGWSTGFKRIPEAMGSYLPIAFISMLFLYFGLHDVYHWTHEELITPDHVEFDPIVYGKIQYLNIPFFMGRLIFYFLVWIVFTMILRKYSLDEDKFGGVASFNKSTTLSAIFMVFFGLTFSFATYDFVMSVNPHWYSTIFAVYIFAGLFVGGITTIAIIAILLKSYGYLSIVSDEHFHDLGKFMFGFTVFWAYIWFAQFLLIWYANIPEETIHYAARWEGPYMGLWAANFVINFIVPFLFLMSRHTKRSYASMIAIGVVILIGRWIDLYQLVIPDVLGNVALRFGFFEIGFFLFYGGLFAFATTWGLARANLMPKNHPYIKESIHHEIPV